MLLIIAKEDSAYGVKKLIEALEERGYKCLPFFIQPYESFVLHPSIELFSDSVHFHDYLRDRDHHRAPLSIHELDLISEWINSSVLNQRGSTGRDWKSLYDFNDVLDYLNTCSSFYDWVIKKYQPRALIDFESDNIVRAVLDVVRLRFKLPYYVYYSTRLDGRVAIGEGIIKPSFDNPSVSTHDLEKASLYIKNYSSSTKLASDEIIFDKRNIEFNLFELIKNIASNILFHLLLFLRKREHSSIKKSSASLYYGGGIYYLFWKIRFLIRKYKDINFSGSKISRSQFKVNYLYFALGQTVEGSEPNFSGGYLNDLDCLNILKSKIMAHKNPLLVKDHRSMLGDRTKYQRKFIDSINLNYVWGKQLCSDEWMSSPQSLVFNAKAVFTLSGSVGLEALISGVPTFIFGEPLYKKVMHQEGINFPRIEDLDDFISSPKSFLPDNSLLTLAIAKLFCMSRQYSLYRIKRSGPLIHDPISMEFAVDHLVDVLMIKT
jgi:hypothetical protein